MLIEKIQKDLFDFIDHDPDELDGLIHFWYTANSDALSGALNQEKGIKLIINVSEFNHFEKLSKKLFLIADKLVIRDTRKFIDEERLSGFYPLPTGEYIPGYFEELKEHLADIKVPPLTVCDQPGGLWTSDNKILNNGHHVAYAMQSPSLIPKEFTKWITGAGREYLKTGSIVYAPFIPPIEWELEFLKAGISLPSFFDSTPCFHQKYDWFDNNNLNALVSLNFPYLENIDIGTLSNIKNDNYDEFTNFSKSLINSIGKIKSSYGTMDFAKEVRYIQKNEIDDNLDKIEQKIKKISQMESLRKSGIVTGLVGLNGAMYAGLPLTGLVTGLTGAAIAMIAEKVAELKDQNEIKSNSSYFLYQIRENAN